MRRIKIISGLFVLIATITMAWTGLASAHSFHSGTNVTISRQKPIHQTVFAAGRTVNIDNEVYGDVFCAGQTVTVSGTIHGDVICAGQSVHVTGKVDGDVRLAGQTVTLGASVAGNATIAGQDFVLESVGSVAGDVSVGSTDATLNGSVGRDLAVGGDSATVTASVGRDVRGSVNTLTLASGARVAGNIDYTSKNNLKKSSGAVVNGSVHRSEPQESSKSKHGAVFGFGLGWFAYWFVAMLLTAMVIALLFPQMLHKVTDKATPRPWKALLVGFLASLAAPAIFVLLALTVVGIPLAFLAGIFWFVVLTLSGPIFGYYLGRVMLRDSKQPLLIMLLGATVLLLLYFIPVVGVIALLAAVWLGSGMLLLEIFERTPRPVYALASDGSKENTRKTKK